jgi:hypothetical protein
VTSTGALDVTATCTRFSAPGLGIRGYGQQRSCKKCAASEAAPATAAAAAAARRRCETADGRPGNNDATSAWPCAPPPPPTKPQNDDARKEFTFTDETGANIVMEICTCNHCSQFVQTSATVNATRLKTHLSQICQKCPGEVKTRAFNSG